ncbi:hypothetical protein D3C87_1766820 [compost metagenome]
MTDFIEFIMKEAGERGVIFKDHRQPDQPNSDEAHPPSSSSEPAGEVSDPPSASPAPTIVDVAKEALGLAVLSYPNAQERDDAIHQCIKDGGANFYAFTKEIDDIAVAARAVATKSRTLDQARAFLADRLSVTIQELSK